MPELAGVVSGKCMCQACEDRSKDIYRMIGICYNCKSKPILMIFRAGDQTSKLNCPVCGCPGTVNAQRLARPDEIPVEAE